MGEKGKSNERRRLLEKIIVEILHARFGIIPLQQRVQIRARRANKEAEKS